MDRRTLAKQFDDVSGLASWKTFVVEAHAHDGPRAFLEDAFGKSKVRPTDDAYLFSVNLSPDVSFIVDSLDARFWSWHTTGAAGITHRSVKAKTSERRDLDFVWLPTAHLRALRRGARPRFVKTDFHGRFFVSPEEVQDLSIAVRGGDADRLVDELQRTEQAHAVSVDRIGVQVNDASLGAVEEYVNRLGVFVARGNSFALHQKIVADVVGDYRRLVDAAERISLRFSALNEGGGAYTGGPIQLRFSRPIPKLEQFLANLFSSREPFRLWGMPKQDGDYATVEAVDLHVGRPVRFEVTRSWIRVYLYDGGCGNTVARLVSNLQHHVDGNLTAADRTLQGALVLNSERAA
jgi:hypothetical protein